MILNNRIGEIHYNTFGSKMIIIDYQGANKILVKFDNNYQVWSSYHYFKIGEIINPYDKNVWNTGYLGEGQYKTHYNNKMTKMYMTWNNMLKRCYSTSYKKETYKDCTVCEGWLNFQIFAKWYDENFYEIENERMELDKDILLKGNKIYSPDNCVFVPQPINALFTKSNSSRGEYPLGLTYIQKNNNYMVQCREVLNSDKKSKYLGVFSSIEEAFSVYKQFKETNINKLANYYKNQIPEKLYNAMINYKVEITD